MWFFLILSMCFLILSAKEKMCCNVLAQRSQIACVGFGLLLLNLPDWKFKPTNRLTFADFYRHPEPLFSAPKKLPSPALNIVSARVPALRVPVRSVTSLHSKLPSLLSHLKCLWFLLRNLSWIFSSYQTYYSFFKILLMFHPLTKAKYIQKKARTYFGFTILQVDTTIPLF